MMVGLVHLPVLVSTVPVTRQSSGIPGAGHGSGLSAEQTSRGSGWTDLHSGARTQISGFCGMFSHPRASATDTAGSNQLPVRCGKCQAMAPGETSCHHSMRHFLSGSLRRLHWVVIVQLTACPGENSQTQQMLLSGGWDNSRCTHSKSCALGSIFFFPRHNQQLMQHTRTLNLGSFFT